MATERQGQREKALCDGLLLLAKLSFLEGRALPARCAHWRRRALPLPVPARQINFRNRIQFP
jgi:hypothetical protein